MLWCEPKLQALVPLNFKRRFIHLLNIHIDAPTLRRSDAPTLLISSIYFPTLRRSNAPNSFRRPKLNPTLQIQSEAPNEFRRSRLNPTLQIQSDALSSFPSLRRSDASSHSNLHLICAPYSCMIPLAGLAAHIFLAWLR